MIQKQDPYICYLQEIHFRPRDTYRLKVKEWKKIFQANGNQNKTGVAILISDKIDFKIKIVTRDKEELYIKIKELYINIYAANIRVHQYIRQLLTAINTKLKITQ